MAIVLESLLLLIQTSNGSFINLDKNNFKYTIQLPSS